MQIISILSIIFVAVSAAPTTQLHQYETRSNVPFKFPLPNGFPSNVSTATLKAIEKQAGGPIPNGVPGAPAASPLSPVAVRALQAVAFNEIFEVAFFTQLLHNITQSVPGFELGQEREAVMQVIATSQAQEELHFLLANTGIKMANGTEIEPCEYLFPVSNFTQAMRMADDFSSLLVGGISDLIYQFTLGHDDTYTVSNQFCGVLGQEGEQEGFFRYMQNKIPNADPFMTSTTLPFIFNHIRQNYIAEGTCKQNLNFPIFQTLTPLEMPGGDDTTVWYSTTLKNVSSKNAIVYMSGQTVPVNVSISHSTTGADGLTTFSASFPFLEGFSRGMTVAALVSDNIQYDNVTAVTDAALAGPGVIQVGSGFEDALRSDWSTQMLDLIRE